MNLQEKANVATYLRTMLAMQDQMNTKVHPEWRDQCYPWYRAIWTEAAEMMDHHGWKWWKKQEPDIAQLQLELVDIWHFYLSQWLENNDESDMPELVQQIIEHIEAAEGHQRRGGVIFYIEELAVNTLVTKQMGLGPFSNLCRMTDLTFEMLYTQYVGKNVLNMFRQNNGYKDGSYRKVWGGREDNEHLVELVSHLDTSSLQFPELVYASLETRYGLQTH